MHVLEVQAGWCSSRQFDNIGQEVQIKEEANDVDNLVLGIYHSNSIRKDHISEGYKDPVMEEWDKVLACTAFSYNKNWPCKDCDYKHHRKINIMNHIETFHPPNNIPFYRCLK